MVSVSQNVDNDERRLNSRIMMVVTIVSTSCYIGFITGFLSDVSDVFDVSFKWRMISVAIATPILLLLFYKATSRSQEKMKEKDALVTHSVFTTMQEKTSSKSPGETTGMEINSGTLVNNLV